MHRIQQRPIADAEVPFGKKVVDSTKLRDPCGAIGICDIVCLSSVACVEGRVSKRASF
jgi:hypothetical protein